MRCHLYQLPAAKSVWTALHPLHTLQIQMVVWFLCFFFFIVCFLLTEPQLKAVRTRIVPEPWKGCLKLPWLNLYDQPRFSSNITPSMKNDPYNDVKLEVDFKIPAVQKRRLKWASLNATPNVPNSAATVLVKLFADMLSLTLGFSCHRSPLSAATEAAVPMAEAAEVSACHRLLQISGRDIKQCIN